MNEGTVLEQARRWSLWVALGSAVIVLLISLLAIWEAVDLISYKQPSLTDLFAGDALGGGGLGGLFGGPELTAWGRLLATFGTLLSTAATILLSLLVASHVKKGK